MSKTYPTTIPRREYPLDNATWLDNLELVRAFVTAQGRFPKKFGTPDREERRLATWRHTYMSLMNRGKLDPDRTKKLLDAGIAVDRGEAMWDAMLERTKAFVAGHGRLPSRRGNSTTTEDEQILGRWRTDQNGFLQRGTLSEARKQKFLAAKLAGRVQDAHWFEMLKAAVQFRKANGHNPRKSGDKPGEQKLGLWCSQNRIRFKTLDDRRRHVFQAAGLMELTKQPSRWEVNFERLRTFCEQHRRLPASKGNVEEQVNYHWLLVQPTAAAKGRLPLERKQKLDRLQSRFRATTNMWQDKWQTGYRLLDLFIQRNHRLPRQTRKSKAEHDVAIWVDRQKTRVRKCRMLPEQARMLGLLHPKLKDLRQFSWTGIDNWEPRWIENYERVKLIAQRTGHMPVQNSPDRSERLLSAWYQRERRLMRDETKRRRLVELAAMITPRKSGPKKGW